MDFLIKSLSPTVQPFFIGLVLWQTVMVLKLWLWVVLDYSGNAKYYAFEAYRFLVSFLGLLIFLWAVCRLLGTALDYDGYWWVSAIALSFVVLFPMNLKFHWTSFNPASGLNMTDLLTTYSKHAIKTRQIPTSGLGASFVRWAMNTFHVNKKTATLFLHYAILHVVLLPLIVAAVFFMMG